MYIEYSFIDSLCYLSTNFENISQVPYSLVCSFYKMSF